MNIAFTLKSRNSKVGSMAVTTSSKASCPPACPLYDGGCYALEGFHTNLHWLKVTDGQRGTDLDGFTPNIEALPDGSLWRHNIAGDLQPTAKPNHISIRSLRKITKANKGKRGFTYSHYPLSIPGNLRAITEANAGGFTVNVSCNNPLEALATWSKYQLPTVTMVPSDFWENGNTRDSIVRCPAEYLDTNCLKCELCARGDRKVIVGFTVHGNGAAAADIIARG